MKIFGWSADSSGCGWYRMQMPLDELARRGHETLVSMQMPDEWLDTSDVLIGQRICKPGPTQIWQRVARHPKRPLMVFEIDDDLWKVPPSSWQAYRWFSLPEVQEALRANIAAADLVTVTTEPLADVVREINPNVAVIPNFVPAAMLDLPRGQREHDAVTVGWAGSSTHVMDFAHIGPQLARFLNRQPDVLWRTIGGTQQAFHQHFEWTRRIRPEQWRAVEWFDGIWDYYRALDQFDIATAPLVEHTFNRSKSPIKALEAASRGLPMVASAVGPYPRFVQHGVTGLLLREPHEWPRALRSLVNDKAMRAELGAAARAQAAEHTIEGNGHLWEQALLSQLTTSSREAS